MPIEPATTAALISSGAPLLGGFLDRGQRRKDAQANSPAGIRKAAEAAGFNPLAFVGHQMGAGYAPTFGRSIANAAASAVDAYNGQQQLELQRSQLELQNQELQQRLERATLRPQYGGIYGRVRQADQSVHLPNDNRNGSRVDSRIANTSDERNSIGDLNKNEGGRFTFLGANFTGSGLFSNGQTMEDALGEGPLQWITSPLVAADAFAHTLGGHARRAIGADDPNSRFRRIGSAVVENTIGQAVPTPAMRERGDRGFRDRFNSIRNHAIPRPRQIGRTNGYAFN